MTRITFEIPDGTPISNILVNDQPITTTGFSVDHPMAEQPDTNKLYGDSNEAYGAAVAGNEAEHAVKFRVITNGQSYRVWPINELGGFAMPAGYRQHATPTEQPSPAPRSFPPAPEGTHDDGLGGPVDPRRVRPDESGGQSS